ncbi:MAG: hypothetical protein ACTH1D_05490 [Mycobacteriaceae bacterium]|uniref:hypothetical protein n=1 Tax=Corynebacterium sp. TaxID=1720 RepID=UPI003F98580D
MGAVSRIRKIALEHPGWVATGWSALAGWGLTYFCDDADTCVLSGGRPRLASHRGDVTRRRNQGVHAGVTVYRPDPWCPELMMVPPVLALADCLRSLARGEHRWNVLPGTGLPDSEVRVVQLIDAVSQVFDVPPGAWPDACLNQTDTARLRRLVKLCDQGAESPMETMMRLLVGRLFPGFISQLVVHGDGSVSDPVHGGDAGAGRIVARLDLGHPGLKLALQYDGSAHLAAGRRDRDSLVNTSLANLGWHVLRVTHGHLRDLDLLAETLQDGIRICRGRSAPRS